MKILTVTILVISVLVSCKSGTKEDIKDKTPKKENLVDVKDGMFIEWYPGRKQIKFKGPQDEKMNRHGLWSFYAEDGTEMSFTNYVHGKKEGFTVVKHPNGYIHYRGEYRNDKPVGLWTTYNEKGIKVNEKDFGYPEE
jgi:antitoxin component YwqK of YwqJK toxin-antitoxin module